jgi:adenylate cyclase
VTPEERVTPDDASADLAASENADQVADSVAGIVAELDIADLVERAEEQMLGGPRRYTRLQVAEMVGVDQEITQSLWRSLGFPSVADDEVVFTDADVTALRFVVGLQEAGLADTATQVAMSRLLGQTFARLASSQGQLLINLLLQQPDVLASEDAIMEAFVRLTPMMQHLQDYVWRRQLIAYFTRVAAYASAEVTTPTLVPMAVGFADMSGFTSLTRRATEAELDQVLEAFESLTTEVVGAHNGRIVKTIGDEVLFLADTPTDCALLALELLERAERTDGLPPLRVGLAAGQVVTRLGDVYGSTVNIASRLTSLSRPGWILVDRGMADALAGDDRFVLRSRRPESVRGFHHLRQWRLKAATDVAPEARRRGHNNRGR